MPELDGWTSSVLQLYQRCQSRGCLPYAGGVLDQPERIMELFDVIDERMAAHKQKMALEAEIESTKGALRGRD